MASGTINLTQSGTLQGYIAWSSTSNGSSANTSNVTAKLYIRKDPTTTTEATYGTWTFSLTINGSTYGTTSWYGSVGQSYVNIASYTLSNVAHSSDGTKTITISGSASGPSGTSMSGYTASGSASCTLDTIPRYATATQTISSKTETTITVKWTSDAKVDYVWYSTNGGSSWTAVGSVNAKTGTYTISSLSAYTSYSVVTRVRRSDSQLRSVTGSTSVKTYNYPYCTSMPNFTIGNTVTLKFYNPLGRTFTMYTICNGTQIAATVSVSGTSFTAYGASSSQSQLYATMPNATSATYQIKCVYSGSTITKTGGTVSIKTSDCKPTITALTYADTYATTTAVTGDDQVIVQNQSKCQFTATGVAAQNSATISSVKVSVNNKTLSTTASGTTYTTTAAKINASSNLTATVTVTDSRGLTASKSVTVTMLAWSAPTATYTVVRQNNYYTATLITANASYSDLDGNNSVSLAFKAGIKSSGSYTVNDTLTSGVTKTVNLDNEYNWVVVITVTDVFTTTTYTVSLARGTPIVFYDVDLSSVGINTFPTNSDSLEALNIYSNGSQVVTRAQIKTLTVSGTTSSNGNLALGLDSTVTVINVVETTTGYECGYYRTQAGNYYATVRAYGSGSKIASTAVTLLVTYIEY